MANGTFAPFRAAALSKQIDLLNDDIRCILIDVGQYTPNLNAHEFLTSVPVGARIATSLPLTGKTVGGGTFDANDATIPGTVGLEAEAVLLYQHTGVDGTARLIAWIDANSSGLPLTPDGTDLTLRFNTAGIFSWINN